MTDRLSLTNALADANIERQKAERIATEIFDAINERVATKADVAAVQTDIAAVRADMQALELRLNQRIDRMVNRLGSLIVVIAGLLFAALHYWPPHG